jgi:arylsulfatase A-like enzyme
MIPKPNIILIILDAVRADCLSCYGHSLLTTSNIDRIAEESTLFLETIATAPWTIPSVGSILTGLSPSEHGATQEHPFLRSTITTLPEILQNNGYYTVAFVANPWLNPSSNLMKGFNEIHFHMNWKSRKKRYVRKILRLLTLTSLYNKFDLTGPGCSYDIIYDAVQTIKTFVREDKPFFLYIHLMDAHLPYIPQRRYLQSLYNDRDLYSKIIRNPFLKDGFVHIRYNLRKLSISQREMELFRCAYNACILEMDECIGKLYSFLKEEKLLDNTLLIITSDHGEEIGDHNLMDHQLCLYDTLLKVPLIIRNQDYFPEGYILKGQVQLNQIYHTILAILYKEKVCNYWYSSEKSLHYLVHTKTSLKYTFSEYHRPDLIKNGYLRISPQLDHRFETRLFCVRSRKYKYIYSEKGKDEFYHLESDPLEKRNLIDFLPEKVNHFKEVLKKWRSSLKFQDNFSVRKIEHSQDVVNKLKSLGYI